MCELVVAVFLSLYIVHLPEIEDFLALQGAVLLINLHSPERSGLVFIGVCIVYSLKRNRRAFDSFYIRGTHSPTSDIILKINGETQKSYIVQEIIINFRDSLQRNTFQESVSKVLFSLTAFLSGM